MLKPDVPFEVRMFSDIRRSSHSTNSCYGPSGQDPRNGHAMQRYRSEYDRHRDFLVNGPGSTKATTSTAGYSRGKPSSVPHRLPDQQRSGLQF